MKQSPVTAEVVLLMIALFGLILSNHSIYEEDLILVRGHTTCTMITNPDSVTKTLCLNKSFNGAIALYGQLPSWCTIVISDDSITVTCDSNIGEKRTTVVKLRKEGRKKDLATLIVSQVGVELSGD